MPDPLDASVDAKAFSAATLERKVWMDECDAKHCCNACKVAPLNLIANQFPT